MFALWRLWGVDTIMRAAWERGIALAGVSADLICGFDSGTTDSWFGPLALLPCLHFLPGSNCLHSDSEPERRPANHRFVASGALPDGDTAAHRAPAEATISPAFLHIHQKRYLQISPTNTNLFASATKRTFARYYV